MIDSIINVISVKNILIYIVIINLITFISMWIDKRKAEKGKWRIKEATLLTLALIGGSIGGIAGMYVFRHKTKKPKFFIGFPAILILHITIIVYIMFFDK